jgi:hypothetical protein
MVGWILPMLLQNGCCRGLTQERGKQKEGKKRMK